MAEARVQKRVTEDMGLKVPEMSTNPKECLSCRVTGTAILAGTGSYAIWQSRAAAPGSPVQKKIVAGLGIVSFAGDHGNKKHRVLWM